MDIIPKEIENYIYQHCTEETTLLQKINRKTQTDVLLPQMLSGKVQGQFLKLIAQIIQPKKILEIGTFTGYAALCLAEGLTQNGILYTIDINEELQDFVEDSFAQSTYKNQIKYIIGNALEIIPTINEKWDLVFIDADKQNYINYYNLIFDNVNTGGIILVDNVLWSGKITDEKKDKDTKALDDFNKKIQQDKNVDNVIVSIRDGIMMIRKK